MPNFEIAKGSLVEGELVFSTRPLPDGDQLDPQVSSYAQYVTSYPELNPFQREVADFITNRIVQPKLWRPTTFRAHHGRFGATYTNPNHQGTIAREPNISDNLQPNTLEQTQLPEQLQYYAQLNRTDLNNLLEPAGYTAAQFTARVGDLLIRKLNPSNKQPDFQSYFQTGVTIIDAVIGTIEEHTDIFYQILATVPAEHKFDDYVDNINQEIQQYSAKVQRPSPNRLLFEDSLD